MNDRAEISPQMVACSHLTRSRYQPRPSETRLSISRSCGLVIALVAFLALFGWIFDIETFKSLGPSWATMKVNTAVSFMLCGLVFWHFSDDETHARNRAYDVAAILLVLAISILTIGEYLLETSFGIDEVLLRQAPSLSDPEFPGRMSMATAVCFLLLGIALLMPKLSVPSGQSISLCLAWILGAISLIGAIGYVYSVESLYLVWPFSTMALHTAILFGVASVGILGAQIDRSPLGFLSVEGSGSEIARRILPFAILAPVLIGWLTLQGANANLYGLKFGLGVVVTAVILAFITMIWIVATALNKAEAISRKAGAALATEAIRRRVLFEQARDGILVLDAEWKIYEANESFAQMLGYSHSELESLKPWHWSTQFRTRETYLAEWSRMPTEGGQIETQIRHKEGHIVHADISYTQAEVDGAKYVYCVYRDVTERKRAQRALQESQERFQRAIANIPDLVVIYDRELRIRYVNNATRVVTGLKDGDLIGRRDEEVFPPEAYESYLPVLKDSLTSKLMRKIDTSLQLPKGDHRSVLITCVPLLGHQGRVREILRITHDYTERQKAEERLHRSELQYRELVEQAADGIFINDAAGNFLLVNTRCCELLGYTQDELLKMNGRDTYLEEDINPTSRRLQQLNSGQDLRYERVLKRKDGSTFPAEVSVKMLDSGRMQVIFHDITTRRAQEKKINRLSRIHAVLSGINSAIVRIRDRRELFHEACLIACTAGKFRIAWIGRADPANGQVEMLAQSGLAIHLDEQESGAATIAELLPDGPGRMCMQSNRPVYDNDIEHSLELSTLRREAIRLGAKSVIALPIYAEGSIFGLMVLYASDRNFFDDEELKLLKELAGDISFALDFIAKEEKVDYLAFYDPLTRLPNRSLFFDMLKRQLKAAKADGERVILQLLDIDRFRMINDTYGRDEADKLICAVADRIVAATGERDTAARVGSDSFAVAVSGVWQAARTAHALEEFNERVFGEPFVLNDEEIRVAATSGVAAFPDDGTDEHALLTNAEAAQRSAEKKNATFLFYSPEMSERVADSIRLESRLRLALEQNELMMWYQPKRSLVTDQLTGFEALMRWQDKESGEVILPGRFIPVLEQTGMILEAGQQALSIVALDCTAWAAQGVGVPSIAVNISLMQLREESFVSSVIDAQAMMEKCGCTLEIELTESVIMENIETIVPKLETLRGLGVLISVDDFGTGYSSLAYISRLPIHSLKIDRAFIHGLLDDENARTIVTSIISLAHSLDLKVVAEGVETIEQAEALADLSCDEVQGYYFGHPIAPAEVVALVRQ